MSMFVLNTELEKQYFNLNLLSLLGPSHSHDEISALAIVANNNRVQQQVNFQDYWERLADNNTLPQIVHRNPDLSPLMQILASGSGCVIALFHMGNHRHIIPDLVLKDLKIAAPIAGKAYWEFYKAKDRFSPKHGNNLTLLEVEEAGVGLSLMRAARKSEILAIYVDGNMGPDGHHVEEGATEIGFFGKKIRVKTGIARLARMLKRPVLPIFSLPDSTGEFALKFGEPVEKPGSAEADYNNTMQLLYDQLAAEVRVFPEHWEYGLCFHRWLVHSEEDKENSQVRPTEGLADDALIRFNSEHYTSMLIDGNYYVVNTQTHRAFKLPFKLSVEAILESEMSNREFYTRLRNDTELGPDLLKKVISELSKKRIVVAQNSTL